jgi:hypothetical protein
VSPVSVISGGHLDAATVKATDEIVRASVTDPVGPEFMAPPASIFSSNQGVSSQGNVHHRMALELSAPGIRSRIGQEAQCPNSSERKKSFRHILNSAKFKICRS